MAEMVAQQVFFKGTSQFFDFFPVRVDAVGVYKIYFMENQIAFFKPGGG